MIGARAYLLVGTLASVIEVSATILALVLANPMWLTIAGLLHLGAVRLAVLAARMRRPDLTLVERDIVVVTSFLPVFGPTLAWMMPSAQRSDSVENAHQAFERYSKYEKPEEFDYERTLFTGDNDKDLARELDAESYHEVLRRGSTDQKCNALAHLAGLAEPKHFRLIRRCLHDPEHEVRLYACAELERASQVFEEKIAKYSMGYDSGAESKLILAKAYYEYSESGIHDEEMAAFYVRLAERFARQVVGIPAGACLHAGALARLQEYDKAHAALDALSTQEQALPSTCLARADIAFRERDFATARAEAERIERAGEELPRWLAALEKTS